MEHQIRTSEFVDGEWISRFLDISHVLSRNREKENLEIEAEEMEPRHEKVRMGLISRTLLPSPYVKFVLPAKIRHKIFNDVAFVGEYSVDLKETRPNGSLRHIVSKSDFAGKILAAKVFGSPRKAQVNTEHGTPIKRKDLHAKRRSIVGDGSDILPWEVLVLTLETPRALMFLFTHQGLTGNVEFRYKLLPLPTNHSRFDQPGPFLAVDPKCRAIAVAAREGQFIWYKTKTMDALREDMRAAREFTVVEDERIMHLHGRIMHMEFLTPAADQDEGHVILLFVVAHDGKTKLTCFDWDARHDLKTATVRAERVVVESEDHNPSLLIPLSRSPDFLLVSDKHISSYVNILSGTINQRYIIPIPEETLPSLHPGGSRVYPCWVQWERVARNNDFLKEALYIARADGKVLYVEVGPSKVPELSDAGALSQTIHRAFASLEVDSGTLNPLQPDVFVAPGVDSDGCVSRIGAWIGSEGVNLPYTSNNTFSSIESIPNWSPMNDMTVIQTPGVLHSPRHSIMIGNGCAPYGTITELRRGIQAPIEGYFGGMSGCRGSWLIEYGTKPIASEDELETRQYALLLATIAPESFLLCANRVNGAWEVDQVQEAQGVTLAGETLSASTLFGPFAVQITGLGARILTRPTLELVDSLLFEHPVFAAASGSQIRHIAVTYREDNCAILETIEVLETGHFGSRSCYRLSSDPTCVEVLDIEGVPHVFVGTSDSSVQLIKISRSSLDLACQYSLLPNDSEEQVSDFASNYNESSCESAALLTYQGKAWVLCGTRNGILVSLVVSPTEGGLEVGGATRVHMGNTPVQVTPSVTDASIAFVSCGGSLCRVHHRRYNSHTPTIESIWFTDRDNESYRQGSTTAIVQLPVTKQDDDRDQDFPGSIFAVSDDSLLLASLDCGVGLSRPPYPQRTKAIPLKYLVKATPRKMLYLADLQSFLVATTEPVEERSVSNKYRIIQSTIQLVRVGQKDDDPTPERGHLAATFEMKNYERVYTMVEQRVQREGTTYRYVVVGTGISTGMQETGRRLFFQVTDTAIKLKKAYTVDAPVLCLATWDAPDPRYVQDPTFLQVAGKQMTLFQLSGDSRWKVVAQTQLPSKGVHVNMTAITAGPSIPHSFLVYVSTSNDSILVYYTEPVSQTRPFNRPEDLFVFKTVQTDMRHRYLASHEVITGNVLAVQRVEPVTLLADKACNVTGLLMRPEMPGTAVRTDAVTLFEAHLPRSVTRLGRGKLLRAPWGRPYSGHPSGLRRALQFDHTYPVVSRKATKEYICQDPADPPTGVLLDDIIGACTDGTVYSFSLLKPPALILLKYIQRLIEIKVARATSKRATGFRKLLPSHPTTAYRGLFAEPTLRVDAPITLGDLGPTSLESIGFIAPKEWHVDGDVIVRFLDGEYTDVSWDEKHALFTLLTTGTDPAVMQRFVELADEALDDKKKPENEMDWAQLVQDWLREVTLDMF